MMSELLCDEMKSLFNSGHDVLVLDGSVVCTDLSGREPDSGLYQEKNEKPKTKAHQYNSWFLLVTRNNTFFGVVPNRSCKIRLKLGTKVRIIGQRNSDNNIRASVILLPDSYQAIDLFSYGSLLAASFLFVPFLGLIEQLGIFHFLGLVFPVVTPNDVMLGLYATSGAFIIFSMYLSLFRSPSFITMPIDDWSGIEELIVEYKNLRTPNYLHYHDDIEDFLGEENPS
ncbi:MAG: hypothetical protein ACW99U_15905 [Candidatus Thorarchaeota archaeon]|jgi:hypothetical protein